MTYLAPSCSLNSRQAVLIHIQLNQKARQFRSTSRSLALESEFSSGVLWLLSVLTGEWFRGEQESWKHSLTPGEARFWGAWVTPHSSTLAYHGPIGVHTLVVLQWHTVDYGLAQAPRR